MADVWWMVVSRPSSTEFSRKGEVCEMKSCINPTTVYTPSWILQLHCNQSRMRMSMNNLPETMNVPRGTLGRKLKATTTITSPRDTPNFIPFPAINLGVSRTANTTFFTALQMWEGVPLHRVSAENLSKKIFVVLHTAWLMGPNRFRKPAKPIWTNILSFQKAGIMYYLGTTLWIQKKAFFWILDS